MVRIGVVSDIHGDYQTLAALVRRLQPLDLLIHAGDGATEIERLSRYFPALLIRAVIGNCDFPAFLGSPYPKEIFFSLAGWKIFLTHGHLYGVKANLGRIRAHGRRLGADLIIFGHTHLPLYEKEGDVTLFNPGSLSSVRCYKQPSYGLLEVTPESINGQILYVE